MNTGSKKYKLRQKVHNLVHRNISDAFWKDLHKKLTPAFSSAAEKGVYKSIAARLNRPAWLVYIKATEYEFNKTNK